MSSHYRNAGVTLLELLITLVIVAILLTAMAPGLGNIVAHNRVDSAADTLTRALHLARTESIQRGHRVVTCLSESGSSCNPASPQKLLVFSDSNRTGEPSTPADIINVTNIDTPAVRISYNRPYLAYAPTGYAAGTNGTFKICDISGKGEFIIVSSLGRTRTGRDYDGDGIVEKTPGSPISC
jgi:type IV fimbrial biogenesis protein FimT